MKLISLLAITYLSVFALFGQTSRTTLLLQPNTPDSWQSQSIQLLEPTASFLAVSAVWEGEADELKVRYSEDERAWSDWEVWSLDAHSDPTEDKASRLLFVDAKNRFIQIGSTVGVQFIKLHFYDPGVSPNPDEVAQQEPFESRSCPCPQPEYLDRDGWCPTGDCPNNPSQPTTVTTHVIVHHSASANTAGDWSAVVRSIWDFHVNVRGWADIGYNWLIAPSGQVFEGRGDEIQGAHFGCAENPSGNINTTGICMIGTYSTETPSTAARNSLKWFLAWKVCAADIDPEGISTHTASGLLLNRISGHRQGCNTECPGNAFFPLLPEVREETAAFIASGCSSVAGPNQLDAESNIDGGVDITWVDNTEDEVAFELERSKALPNNFSLIATLDPNTTSYSDLTAEPNSGYYYRVRALTPTDTSAYSNEDFAFTFPTSTNDLFNEGEVKLFPNPSESFIWLEMANPVRGEIRMEMMNVNGQLVVPAREVEKTQEVEKFIFNFEDIPSGIYWLKLSHEKGTGVLPFVVE